MMSVTWQNRFDAISGRTKTFGGRIVLALCKGTDWSTGVVVVRVWLLARHDASVTMTLVTGWDCPACLDGSRPIRDG